MSQVSKYPISEKVYLRCWEIFVKSLAKFKSNSDTELLINDLFTPTERIMLAKRLAIASLLMKGFQCREIKSVLKVSATTIAMINKNLFFGNGGMKKIIENILKDEKLGEQLNQIAQSLLSLPANASKGGEIYRYLKSELKNSPSTKRPF